MANCTPYPLTIPPIETSCIQTNKQQSRRTKSQTCGSAARPVRHQHASSVIFCIATPKPACQPSGRPDYQTAEQPSRDNHRLPFSGYSHPNSLPRWSAFSARVSSFLNSPELPRFGTEPITRSRRSSRHWFRFSTTCLLWHGGLHPVSSAFAIHTPPPSFPPRIPPFPSRQTSSVHHLACRPISCPSCLTFDVTHPRRIPAALILPHAMSMSLLNALL